MSKTEKFEEKLFSHPTPHDLSFEALKEFFTRTADKTEVETGNRFVVEMNGHRVVFREPHNGLASEENIADARRLLKVQPGQTLEEAADNPNPTF